jgi:hypothetical protein
LCDVLQTLTRRKNLEELNLENEGSREWDPHFLSNDKETPCPEGTNMVGEVRGWSGGTLY